MVEENVRDGCQVDLQHVQLPSTRVQEKEPSMRRKRRGTMLNQDRLTSSVVLRSTKPHPAVRFDTEEHDTDPCKEEPLEVAAEAGGVVKMNELPSNANTANTNSETKC